MLKKYRILSWEELLEKGDLGADGNIRVCNPNCSFTKYMKHLCGKVYYIDFSGYVSIDGYQIEPWMVEEEEQFEPKEGDRVMVMEHDDEGWKDRIFLMTSKKGKHLCVFDGDEELYIEDGHYETALWSQIKPLPPKESITIEVTKEQKRKIEEILEDE